MYIDASYIDEEPWVRISKRVVTQRRSDGPERKILVEECFLMGVTFRRYPEAKRLSDTRYFQCSSCASVCGERYLHRAVWCLCSGKRIPKGKHIHHVDEDFRNNGFSNLELVDGSEHLSKHALNSDYIGSVEHKKRLREISELAKEWHRSEEGRLWHSEHAKKVFARRDPVELVCEFCGDVYQTLAGHARFCSNRCKAAARRASGIDLSEYSCEICGVGFESDKNSPTRTCSRSCGAKLRWKERREKASI
jgi:hypothetical protein